MGISKELEIVCFVVNHDDHLAPLQCPEFKISNVKAILAQKDTFSLTRRYYTSKDILFYDKSRLELEARA